uniref:Ig-like domain-containing protein n=1 Tax=Cyprinodon variegatus TaxID=28743 RepID=A0A3Q2DUW9_CYPVA
QQPESWILTLTPSKTQILVKQTPESTSVQEGDTVNLHCSLLTKTSINSLQCPSNYSVYWFKAGSGESYPSLIYTPKNSSDVQQRSCVYKLSKTIQNSSDTGIYYCAVITFNFFPKAHPANHALNKTHFKCNCFPILLGFLVLYCPLQILWLHILYPTKNEK